MKRPTSIMLAIALAGAGIGSEPAWAQPAPDGPEFQVNTYTSNGQAYPRVAATSSGDFVVVWHGGAQDGSGYGVFGRMFDSAGSALTGEFQVNSYTSLDQFYPAVARGGDGGFVVVWSSLGQDGSLSGVFGQRFDSAGAPQGLEFQVNTYTTGLQYFPAVAMDAAGDFVVVWNSVQDGSGVGVFGQRFDSAGAPQGLEFQVNTNTLGYQRFPAVAMDSTGGFVVVWHGAGQDGSADGVLGQRFDSAGGALGSEFLVNTYTTGYQNYPALAMAGTGDFVVVWRSLDQAGPGYGVFGRRFDSAGGALGSEFLVNTYTTGYQNYPALAMAGTGDFVVVWRSLDQAGPGYGVFGRRFDSAGAPQGSEFQVNTTATTGLRYPAVAMNDAAAFVVMWQSPQDGSGYGVVGRRFDASGAPLDPEFQVNTFTTGRQSYPTAAIDGSGRIAAAWGSTGQDGSGEGVFGQRLVCLDADGDGLCDPSDVVVTAPMDAETLDCSNPLVSRPMIEWSPGNYDRFRVFLASEPGFSKTSRVTSGDTLLKRTSWTPPAKKWRNACGKAFAADPFNPALYVRVQGVDVNVSKRDSLRKTFSQTVRVDVSR